MAAWQAITGIGGALIPRHCADRRHHAGQACAVARRGLERLIAVPIMAGQIAATGLTRLALRAKDATWFWPRMPKQETCAHMPG